MKVQKNGKTVMVYPQYLVDGSGGDTSNINALEFNNRRRDNNSLSKYPIMTATVKAVIDSILGRSKNEGFNSWRGGGSYSIEGKRKYEENPENRNGRVVHKKDVTDGRKIVGRVFDDIEDRWEAKVAKHGKTTLFYRHTFIREYIDKNHLISETATYCVIVNVVRAVRRKQGSLRLTGH
jgi:stalled ribosome alternative rescue factor ArfA